MNTALWDNILKFDPDNPVSEYGFTTRLAAENSWTKNFTDTAILEYKKFMYLAATSDTMVSPSEIVDIVWHQHLIFTQSYHDFCYLLEKQVQHIPSTHNRKEYEKFKQARERTAASYRETFGTQPKEIWEYSNMFDTLELPKAGIKIRSFVLIGILLFIALLGPCYFLLKPIYVNIDNPFFLFGFTLIAVGTFSCLQILNRNYLTKTSVRFPSFSFIFKLQPAELVYLKTQRIENVIHDTINRLLDRGAITINSQHILQQSSVATGNNKEEHQVLDVLQTFGQTGYTELLEKLRKKPTFSIVANSMTALRKYHTKSKSFGKLFYINFLVLSVLMMSGTIRLFTGLLRDKPVVFISIALAALAVATVIHLLQLTMAFCRTIVPNLYRTQVLPALQQNQKPEWQYFLLGNAALATAFVPMVKYVDRSGGDSYSYDSTSSASSSSDSGDSSCGSGGSSCGGCGGGGD